jgi:Domain of unknown function DUF29
MIFPLQSVTLTPDLYDSDYALWIEVMIDALKSRRLSTLDIENLIEELEGMNRSDRRAIDSLLTRLFEHFIKIAYWDSERARNAKPWSREIVNFRIQLLRILKESSSLKNYLFERVNECYADAREIMSKEMDVSGVPAEPFFTPEQILDKTWLPIDLDADQ